MYTQYHKGLSVVLLTSILLQGCGSGNTYLAHEREVPNSSGSIKQKALASEQLREPYIQRVPEENSDWTPTLHQEQQTAEQSATPSARPTSQVGKGKPNRRTSLRRHQKHLASSPAQTFTTVQGEQVMFHQTQGQWQATVTNPVTSQKNTLDVKCAPGYTVETLAHWDPSYQKHRLHVYGAQGVVYLGPLGLAGGMIGGAPEEKANVISHDAQRTELTPPTTTPQPTDARQRVIQHFRGEDAAGVDLRQYERWYDNTTLEALASTLGRAQSHALTVVFHDYNPADLNTSFLEQLKQLKLLRNYTGKKTVLFISKEPGAGANHYLFGMLYQNNLILINPVGTTTHQDFYVTLADVKAKGLVEEVYLSSNRIQDEDSLVSCGPICAELLLHYGAMEQEALEERVALLYSLGQALETHGLHYQEVAIEGQLPDALRTLVEATVDEAGYRAQAVALRQSHLERLTSASALPEQVLFSQLVVEGKSIEALEKSEAYRQLTGGEVLQQAESVAPSSAMPSPTVAPSPATVEIEGKHISTSYWYEDREMSSILQAALKRYSHEVSADRTCYTQADGSTITILGPLDNLSPQGLGEALLAHNRQPGTVLIPFNLGVLHWVGLLLAYETGGKLLKAEYYDSLQKDVPHYLNETLHTHSLSRDDGSVRAFTLIQDPSMVMQPNGSDCGPCTIENLLTHAGIGHTPERDSARRRYYHLRLLEESIADEGDQRYYDDLYARQQRDEASFRTPAALGTREQQGPSKAEEAHKEMAQRRKKIETQYAQLLSLASTTIDLPLVEALLVDLQWLLEEEKTFDTEEGEESAQEYLTRLRNNTSLAWTREQYNKLTELLEQAYAQELRRVAHDSPLIDPTKRIERLLTVLNQLATLHEEQGAQASDLSLYTDAAVLYQHAISVCEKKDPAYAAQKEVAYEGLARVRAAMLTRAQGEEVELAPSESALREEIDRDRIELGALREEARDRIATLEEAEMNDETAYMEGSRTLFTDIADRMAAFLQRLYEESEQEVGPAPCSYTVIGLGSMALKQMTPYSDLEFAILMEDHENEEVLEEHREYFRKLSHLVHLRVINLGETVAPMSKYQFSLDHLGKKGVNFDLGGKTPLGRKDKAHLVKPYELIQPVRGMMRYLRNEDQRMEHMDKLLPFILEATCHVHGDRALYDTYVEEKNSFLMEGQSEQGVSVYKARALQKLLEGVVEMDYRGGGPGITERKQGDLGDFSPNLEQDQHGRLYDVKQEIYRLPDRLLYRLAMYYGVLPESAWDAVLQLQEKGIINEEAARHLQYAASFATILRLRTYTHHGWQKDVMAVLESDEGVEAVQRAFRLPSEALQSGGSFFKYYYTALPLHEKMEAFFKAVNIRPHLPGLLDQNPALASEVECLFGAGGQFSLGEEAHFFKREPFFESGLRVDARIYERLMQPSAALGCYEALIKKGGAPEELTEWLNNAGVHYEALGETRKGLAFQVEALEMRQALFEGQNHPELASSLNNVGLAYEALGQGQEGLKYKKQALEMFRALFEGQNHPKLASSLNNVGAAYHALGQGQEALKYKKQALEMRQALFEGQNHPDIAGSLNNVGIAYEALGQGQEGLKYKKQALEMRQALFEGQNHPDIASSLNNVGAAYDALGQGQEALKYKKQALEMSQALFEGQKHPQLASSLMGVGVAYHALGQGQEALRYLKQALEMFRALFEGQKHPELASSLNNVGIAYQALGQGQEALKYKKQALEMRQALFEGQNHPELASSLMGVGVAYEDLGQSQEALRYFKQALEMRQALFEGQNHPELASSLNNVGNAYGGLGQGQEALKYLKQALEMSQALFEGQNHPELASSLNNVGNAYHALGQGQEALRYLKQALEMKQALFEGQNHPELASSLNNVGIAYQALGQGQEALKYKKQALEMRQALFEGQNHPQLASSLNNVGNAYQALGQGQEALKYLKQALEMRQALFEGQNHPELASSLNNVGNAYRGLGQGQEALRYFKQALEMFRALFEGQNHPQLARSLNNVGVAYQALGQGQEALKYKKQALEMSQALFEGQNHPELASSLNNVGNAYGGLGQSQEALKYKKQALEMRQALFEGQNHPELASSLNNVGNAYEKLGDLARALTYYREALGMFEQLGLPPHHPHLQTAARNVERIEQESASSATCLRAAQEAYQQHDLEKAIQHCEEALRQLAAAGQEAQVSQYYFLGCMYHVAAVSSSEEVLKQEYINKATAAFQTVVLEATSSTEGLVYYANFLLTTGQADEAYRHLRQVLALGNGTSSVSYNTLERATVPEALQKHIDETGLVLLRCIDYAYFLFIHNYDTFAQAGIPLERTQEEYLLAFKASIEQNAGEAGKEKQDEMAYYLLGGLQEVQGNEESAQEAFLLSQEARKRRHHRRQAERLEQPQASLWSSRLEAAQKAYRNQDVAGAIRHYEEALQALPAEQEESSSGLYHNLGCMHHVAALNTEEEAAAQTHLDSAIRAFEAAVAASKGVRAGLYAEYANFLLATAQLEAAQHYLSQAVESGDTAGGLGYSTLEQGTVHEALQGRIEQGGEVTVRGIDYAYFLLIHNYDTFVQSGITLDRTQEEYLLAFKTSIEQNAGEAGKEKEDEMAYYLLGTLQQALGNEEAAQEAFLLSQAIALARAA